MTKKNVLERLNQIAIDAKKSVQPERFWDDVIVVCDLAREATFHLSETLSRDDEGAQVYAASKFLQRYDGRS